MTLTSTKTDGQVLCPEEEITFTCVTTGSTIISWTSKWYIDPGGAQLQLSTISSRGETRNSTFNLNTTATLTNKWNEAEIPVLESQLRIITSTNYPNLSVTCINDDYGTTNTTTFQILGKCIVQYHCIHCIHKWEYYGYYIH